jgi:hypothetical protein
MAGFDDGRADVGLVVDKALGKLTTNKSFVIG